MIFDVKRRRARLEAPGARPRSGPAARRPVDTLAILNRVSQDPVDLDLLTAALAIELVAQPLDARICLTLAPTARPDLTGMNWTLTVNSDHDEVRRRFSIAHAIGHVVMHADLIGEGLSDDLSYRCPADGPQPNPRLTRDTETAANRIATTVLLPRDAVCRRHAELGDLAALARHFRVNPRMMRIRLDGLGLDTPGPDAADQDTHADPD